MNAPPMPASVPDVEFIDPNRCYTLPAIQRACGVTSRPAWTRVRSLELEDGSKVADHIIGMGRKKFLPGMIVIKAMLAHTNRRRRQVRSAG